MAGFQAGLAARHIDLVDSWDYDKRQQEMVEADAGNTVVLPKLTRLFALKRVLVRRPHEVALRSLYTKPNVFLDI